MLAIETTFAIDSTYRTRTSVCVITIEPIFAIDSIYRTLPTPVCVLAIDSTYRTLTSVCVLAIEPIFAIDSTSSYSLQSMWFPFQSVCLPFNQSLPKTFNFRSLDQSSRVYLLAS